MVKVLVPYIKAKLDGLYKKISGRNEEDFVIQNELEQERTGFSRLLHKFIIHFYPYFNFIYEGVLLIYQIAYMHDYSNYYDWFLHLQSIDVKRMMFSEYVRSLFLFSSLFLLSLSLPFLSSLFPLPFAHSPCPYLLFLPLPSSPLPFLSSPPSVFLCCFLPLPFALSLPLSPLSSPSPPSFILFYCLSDPLCLFLFSFPSRVPRSIPFQQFLYF